MMAIINSIKDLNDPMEMANVFELCKKFNSLCKNDDIKEKEIEKRIKDGINEGIKEIVKEETKDEAKDKAKDEAKDETKGETKNRSKNESEDKSESELEDESENESNDEEKVKILSESIMNNMSKIKEKWKKIDGCSRYKISNYGKIRMCNGKLSTRKPGTDGYVVIILTKDDNTLYRISIHKLVALHFIINDDTVNKTQVDHINRIRDENYVWNLRWVSQSENNKNQTRNKEINCRKIAQYDLNGNFCRNWISTKEINDKLGIPISSITHNCLGNSEICNDYIFKYIEDPSQDDMEGEFWKVSADFSDIKVSNCGRIDTKRNGKSYGSLNCKGYYRFHYNRNGIDKEIRVSRIVCKTFNPVPNCDNLEVDHIDGNTKNNHIDNLQFVTGSENCKKSS